MPENNNKNTKNNNRIFHVNHIGEVVGVYKKHSEAKLKGYTGDTTVIGRIDEFGRKWTVDNCCLDTVEGRSKYILLTIEQLNESFDNHD